MEMLFLTLPGGHAGLIMPWNSFHSFDRPLLLHSLHCSPSLGQGELCRVCTDPQAAAKATAASPLRGIYFCMGGPRCIAELSDSELL